MAKESKRYHKDGTVTHRTEYEDRVFTRHYEPKLIGSRTISTSNKPKKRK